jgi:hypothetical protein
MHDCAGENVPSSKIEEDVLGDRVCESGSGPCSMAHFGASGIESSDSVTREFAQLSVLMEHPYCHCSVSAWARPADIRGDFCRL